MSSAKESAQAKLVQGTPVAETATQVRETLQHWKQAGESIAFVPTMGNLHEGHLALVKAANEAAKHTVVSIFVNPTQFGENEDFSDYPRTFDDDISKLANYKVDLVFVPDVKQLYPSGVRTGCYVDAPLLGDVLEGEHRPGFFRGVATVVNKLFNIVQPDIAIFGEKDYQQLLVIRQMVRDLAMPIDIQAVATVREPDGLAMSSRNAYLDADQRKMSSGLYDCLEKLVYAVNVGTDISYAVIHASQHLEAQGFVIDYVVIRRQQDLAVPETTDNSLIALAAVRLNGTRLIDNIPFNLNPQSI